jgi:hypothetical protein
LAALRLHHVCGGVRQYGDDESQLEYKSHTRLSKTGIVNNHITEYTIRDGRGGKLVYGYIWIDPNFNNPYDSLRRAYLTKITDAKGRSSTLSYITTNGVVLLTGYTDIDNRTVSINYSTAFPYQIGQVTGPYATSEKCANMSSDRLALFPCHPLGHPYALLDGFPDRSALRLFPGQSAHWRYDRDGLRSSELPVHFIEVA